MPPKTTLPPREKLLELRERGFSNVDIAERYGVRADYISQVIRNGFNHYRGKIVDVDPRDYLPQLASEITDEMVEQWRTTRTCMCGCGNPVTIRNANTSGGPRGSYTYFSVGHVNRFKPYRDRLTSKVIPQWQRDLIREARLAECVDAAPMVPIINSFLADHGMRVYELAQQLDMESSYLSEVRVGSRTRVRKDLHKKFLEGIKEPMINPVAIKDMVLEFCFDQKLTLKRFCSMYDLDQRWLDRVLDGSQKQITRVMAAKLLTSIGEPLMPELQKYAPEKDGRRVTRKRVV